MVALQIEMNEETFSPEELYAGLTVNVVQMFYFFAFPLSCLEHVIELLINVSSCDSNKSRTSNETPWPLLMALESDRRVSEMTCWNESRHVKQITHENSA